VEKQNERLSATAIKYKNELKFAYGRVRVRVKFSGEARGFGGCSGGLGAEPPVGSRGRAFTP